MSRMNAPWANPEQFGDALPEFLRSPMTLAMGASILAHGVFFLGLPVVANHGDPQDIRPVNVVQLTPQDQAQVPAIALQPQQPSSLIPNPLSPNGSPNGLFTPPIPVSPNPSSNSTPFDFPGFSGGSTSQPRYSFPLDNPDNSYLQDQIRVAEAREAEVRSVLERERLRVAARPSPTPSPSVSPSPTPSVTPTSLSSAAPSVTPSASPSANPSTTPSATPPLKLAAANSPEERAKNQALYQFDDGSQPGSKANQSGTWGRLSTWFSSPKQQENFGKTKSFPVTFPEVSKPPEELPYPTATTPLKNYQETILGFITNPEGTVLDQPEILQSSGYLKLDLAAIEAIKKTKFPTTPNGESFVYRLKFKAPG